MSAVDHNDPVGTADDFAAMLFSKPSNHDLTAAVAGVADEPEQPADQAPPEVDERHRLIASQFGLPVRVAALIDLDEPLDKVFANAIARPVSRAIAFSVAGSRPDSSHPSGGIRMALQRAATGAPAGEHEREQQAADKHHRNNDNDRDDARALARVVSAPTDIGVFRSEQQQRVDDGRHPQPLTRELNPKPLG